MKNIIYILTILLILSACKGRTQKDKEICISCDYEEEMQRIDEELDKFDKIIIEFYNQIDTNPNEVIKQTEILINNLQTEPDPDNIKWNKLGSLYDLRAETFYRMGKYQNSIDEIYKDVKNSQEMFNSNKISFNGSHYILGL